jgi:hypothetical protein
MDIISVKVKRNLRLISSPLYEHTVAMSRKKTPKAQQRTKSIQVKATAEQKRILADAAAREHLPLSTWLLSLGLKAASS